MGNTAMDVSCRTPSEIEEVGNVFKYLEEMLLSLAFQESKICCSRN